MDAFIGKQMENSFQDYVLTNSGLLITDIGSIDFANPLTRQNEEVDLFGKAGDTYILGECKWLNEKVSSSVFYRLEDRAGQLIGKEEKVKYYSTFSSFSLRGMWTGVDGYSPFLNISTNELREIPNESEI